MDKTKKRRIQILAASVFWLGVWQAAAAAIGQEDGLLQGMEAGLEVAGSALAGAGLEGRGRRAL